jgi:glucose/arabinose dehydrogenase
MINRLCITVIIFICTVTSTFAQYTLVNAFPNLSFSDPVYLTHSGDGSNRVFVVEQDGIIKVFNNIPTADELKTFLNISDRVASGGEMGLLGLTFHPNYETNGYFYVNYTASNPRRTIVSRFQVTSNPDSADKNSEFEIIVFNQPYSNHNAGWIGFGPSDGYLYIATGDGGSGGDPQNNAQNITNLLGKILRIDVDGGTPYAIPNSNPFFDSSGNVAKAIYAWGLRNPWRASHDPVTGWLWVGDVGQNSWEEIDIINNGKNYGWRCFEGTHTYNSTGCNYPEYIDPIWEYSHSLGYSVTGGYVYRGPNIPELVGKYIYGDYGSRRIWSIEYDGVNPPTNELLLTASSSVASFGVDEENELFVTSLNDNIYRFEPTVPVNAPSNLDGYAAITLGTPPIIEVELTWQDNSNNEDGFIIERKIESGSFQEIAILNKNVTAYLDWDLLDSTLYTYRVRAFHISSVSPYSNEFEVTTPVRLAAPSNLVATSTGPTQVLLNWQDNTMYEDGFKIERKLEGGVYSLIDSVTTNISTYLDDDVSDGTVYYYRIYAFLNGIVSFYSNEDSAKTPLIVGIEEGFNPEQYYINQNYPNPFNPSTTIKFNIPEESNVGIKIFNSLGKEIDTITDQILQPGVYSKTWNADKFSSGIYYLKMSAKSLSSNKVFSNVIKMIYLK